MKYFFYQRRPTGQFRPCTSVLNPLSKRGDNVKQPPVIQCMLLGKSEENLTLDQLAEIYPLKESSMA